MSNRLNGTSLFLQAINGLVGNYAQLMTGVSGKGLTLENITNPSEDVDKNQLNYTFVNYLTNNFGKIDKDGDGIISKDELQTYTTNMSRNGLTYEQLCELCYNSNYSGSLLETVLNNFSEIDKNGDGRITNEEIAAYGIENEIEEMKDKYPKHTTKGMSIFYETSADKEIETEKS